MASKSAPLNLFTTKPRFLQPVLVVSGAILFNFFFWQQKWGVNCLLFDAFILCSVFYLYPKEYLKGNIKWLLAGHIIAATALIIHNTIISKLAFSFTSILLIVFTQYRHASIWYAAGSIGMNYIFVIPHFFTNIKGLRYLRGNTLVIKKILRFIVIPLLLLFIFFALYSSSNVIFNSVVTDISKSIRHFFNTFFKWFSWGRFCFIITGLFITGGLLLKSKIAYFSDQDMAKPVYLIRKKGNLAAWKKTSWFQLLTLIMGRFANGNLALKNENLTGIMSLVLLNILLLIINCIDVIYVWFGFKYKDDINLSKYVHEGTGILIFSIIVAIVLLLFFFRRNLNFYKANKVLKWGAYAWLFQNMVLVISVFMRDYYYILNMGLAYKRIGVLFFLMMVLFGLITIYIKIHQLKTNYFLVKINAWFALVLLVTASCIHWDETIASYNLARKNSIPLDIEFLLSLSDKTLPVLDANQDIFNKQGIVTGEGELLYRHNISPKEFFEQRKQNFINEQTTYNWLSWNYADEEVKKYFLHHPAITQLQKL